MNLHTRRERLGVMIALALFAAGAVSTKTLGANLDETTAHWIKVSASEDGTFRVVNGRTAGVSTYQAR